MFELGRIAVLITSLAFAGTAIAQDDKVDRLTDSLVEMLPMGKIFDRASAENPAWPMQEKPDAVTPEQLACVRQALSTPGYRRAKRVEVEDYAKAHPSRVEDELRLLESGASALMGKLVMGGAESTWSNKPFDQNEVLKAATSEQVLAFMTFISDPNYAELRKLSGMGDVLSPQKSRAENEQSGEQLGFSLGAQQMLKAMGTCKVPPSAYL